MRQTLVVSFLCISLTLAGCANSHLGQAPNPAQEPGLIDDYSLLQPVATDSDDIKQFRYINPEFKRSDYHAVIIEPVVINQNTGESGVKPEVLAQTRNTLDNYLHDAISKKFTVTTIPGPGVAKLRVIITGAELQPDSFKPRNLLPVSAVIKLTSMATGYDGKRAVLEVAAKVTDSQSNKVLGVSVMTINGEKFRDSANTAEEFKSVAKIWVGQVVKNAAGITEK